MRLLALTCEVLARSVYLCAARSPHVVDVRLNRRGLHDDPPNLRAILQGEIDGIGAPYDAVALAYGLCGGATAGLRAAAVRSSSRGPTTASRSSSGRATATRRARGPPWHLLVCPGLPRADGRRERIRGRGGRVGRRRAGDPRGVRGEVRRGQRRVPDGGPGAWRSHYDRAAFVEMGVADPRGAAAVEERARDDAARRGWAFEKLAGELLLVKRSSTATGVPRTSSCCGRASAWPCRTTRR